MSVEQHIELLNTLFPQQAMLSIRQSAHACNLSEKTAWAWIAGGTWPTPTHKVGRRRVVLVADLAAYLSSLESPPRRPGRPRKGDVGGAV